MNEFTSPILRGFQIKAYLEDASLDSISTTRQSGNGSTGPGNGTGGGDGGDLPPETDPPNYPPDPIDPSTPGGEPTPPADPVPTDPPPPPKPGDKDGDGIPDAQDPHPNTPDLLSISLSSKPGHVCIEDTTYDITGVAEGPHPITKIVLLINGVQTEVLIPNAGVLEQSFKFTVNVTNYPDGFVAEAKGFDDFGTIAIDKYTFNVIQCEITTPPPVRNCLMFDSLHLEYFDDRQKDMIVFDIPSSWLPYVISGKNGADITIGWGETNGITIWFSGGENTTGYAFLPSSVGINYLDEQNNAKTVWALNIIQASAGVKNAVKLLGDPAAKTYPWIDQIKTRGDYSMAPTMGRINDYINIGFGTTWNTKQCPLNKTILKPLENIKPVPDPTNPTIPTYDPSQTPERDCLEIDQCMIQFYNLDDHEIDMMMISKDKFNQELQALSTVTIKAGWSTYFNGMVIRIDSATGIARFPITALGVQIKDYYGNTITAWSDEIKYYEITRGFNMDVALGGPKDAASLTWIPEIEAGSWMHAPHIGDPGDYAVFGFSDKIETGHCTLPPAADADPVNGIDPANPPDKPYVYLKQTWLPETCIGDPLVIEGWAIDQYGVNEVQFFAGGSSGYRTEVESHSVTGLGGVKRYDFKFTLDTSTAGPGNLSVTIVAKNTHGWTSPTVVNYPESPHSDTNFKDCSPPPPPLPRITMNNVGYMCDTGTITVTGFAESDITLGHIEVWDQNNTRVFTWQGHGERSANINFTIAKNTYPAGTNLTFTATVWDASGDPNQKASAVTTGRVIVCDTDSPPPVNVYTPYVTLYLYDGAAQDDDRLNMYLNGSLIMANLSLMNDPNGMYLDITLQPGTNEIKFEGVRDGGGGCTADIKLFERDRISNPLYPAGNHFDSLMNGPVTNYMFDQPLPQKIWYVTY